MAIRPDGQASCPLHAGRCSPPRPVPAPSPPWPPDRPLRKWQVGRAAALEASTGDAFLASATPAAGKTTFGLHIAHRMLVAPAPSRASWSSRRPRTSAASGPPTRRATASTSSPTAPTARAPSRATATASPSPTRRSPPARPCTAGAPRRADAADRRRAPPHGRARGLGPDRRAGVRRRAPQAAAVGHAVPLRQHADPVGRLRRRRRLELGLRVLLHPGAAGPRLPPR